MNANDILNNLITGRNIAYEIRNEKFKDLSAHQVSKDVYDYILSKFNNLTINICDWYQGTLVELMNNGLLEGWCWQTTEVALLFLNDDDYIERGYLNFSKYEDLYYHSYIVFNYKNIEYVFDPCLRFLVEKKYYHNIFEVVVKAKINALNLKRFFLSAANTTNFTIIEEENPNVAFYRSDYCKYSASINNDAIKKVHVKYMQHL